MNNKYEHAIQELKETGTTQFKVFGNSMMPKIKSGSVLTFFAGKNYAVGDVVFCRVKGRCIDAHLITAKAKDGRYFISNNQGHGNGWSRMIYGRVIAVNGEKFGRKCDL